MSRKMMTLALAALAGAVAVHPASAQTADEVLAKHYENMGGLEAWQGLQTMRASGTLNVMNMMEGPFTIVQKRPSMARMEITMQGMEIVQAYDGETAWQIMPFSGSTEPQVADAATARQLIEQADMDGPLMGWKEEGHQVEVEGTETVEGTEAIKLKVTLNSGDVSYYYLDSEYYVPIRIVSVREIQGAPTEITTVISDYKPVNGLMMPHTITVDSPMGQQSLTFDSIEVNVEVDETVFSMPGN